MPLASPPHARDQRSRGTAFPGDNVNSQGPSFQAVSCRAQMSLFRRGLTVSSPLGVGQNIEFLCKEMEESLSVRKLVPPSHHDFLGGPNLASQL